MPGATNGVLATSGFRKKIFPSGSSLPLSSFFLGLNLEPGRSEESQLRRWIQPELRPGEPSKWLAESRSAHGSAEFYG